jgi:hypothetical protein
MYHIDEAMRFIQAALKLSQRPHVHIWFNRFPPPYLEGYGPLIQDPSKLNDKPAAGLKSTNSGWPRTSR